MDNLGILYIDDEQGNLDAFRYAFGEDYPIMTCLSAVEAIEILKKEGDRYALLIADQKMPGMTGIDLCEKVAVLQPQLIRMILTAFSDTRLLLDAINRGHVHDYIVKPWNKENLKPLLDKALQEYHERAEKIRDLELKAMKAGSLEKEVRDLVGESIVGEQAGLKGVLEVVKKVAPTDSTILILGETGTGKELLARAVHDRSRRAKGPFIPVHCASLASTLMESELFGHEKGAFTGADQMHVGRFEVAKGGTIFLDEIGELSEEIQVKLLRVLQEKEIYRVGGNRPIAVDVRLVAATHRNLEEMVRSGKFREDLYYRLNVILLKVPPLRDRKEDLPALANFFLKKSSEKLFKRLTFAPETIDYLARYDWPGNIRELQNMIERAVILSEGPMIEPDDLNLNIEQTLRVDKVDMSKPLKPLSVKSKIQEEEMKKLTDILTQAKGNVTEASRISGIPRTTLFHRLRKYHII